VKGSGVLGFKFPGSGFGGANFRVGGYGERISGLGVMGSEFPGSGFTVKGSNWITESRSPPVECTCFRVWGSGEISGLHTPVSGQYSGLGFCSGL